MNWPRRYLKMMNWQKNFIQEILKLEIAKAAKVSLLCMEGRTTVLPHIRSQKCPMKGGITKDTKMFCRHWLQWRLVIWLYSQFLNDQMQIIILIENLFVQGKSHCFKFYFQMDFISVNFNFIWKLKLRKVVIASNPISWHGNLTNINEYLLHKHWSFIIQIDPYVLRSCFF